MQLDKITEDAAARHAARSLEDLKDQEKIKMWTSGERAREQAEQIVAELVNEALKAIEPGAQSNAG